VLERGRVGQTWRNRWEGFCLVTPNWSVQLPDGEYTGPDPNGFMPRDEIVAHLERYAAKLRCPLRESVDVQSLDSDGDGGFVVGTSSGDLLTRAVVLATGAYQRPHRPPAAAALPTDLLQLDVEAYRSPEALPPGRVLVVGSGQSGCQIAEELHEAGRDVVLACGRAPWAPRRMGDHDLVWWLREAGYLEAPFVSLPSPSARLFANVVSSGRNGGHDLHLRTLRRLGVILTGHLLGAEGDDALFAPDLGDSVAWGDERYGQLMDLIRKTAAERGLEAPIEEPDPFHADGPERVDLSDFGTVIFAGGFRPDYRSWLPWSHAFDELGFPIQREGASTVVPGLYFVGVHFLRKRKSSLLLGVGEDAAIVAQQVAERLG
jgi:putative flavoprotein involved in K+ transport